MAAMTEALETSEHVLYVQKLRARFGRPLVALSAEEIALLERNGNEAESWDTVWKTRADVTIDAARIRDCQLQGFVIFGRFDARHDIGGVRMAAGCYRSALRNVLVLDNALVKDCMALSNVVVDAHSSVVACGTITCPAPTAFGNGRVLSVGVETGGRDLRVFAELSFADAARVACDRSNAALLETMEASALRYAQSVTCTFSVIGHHARVWRCPHIDASFVGPHAVVEDSEVFGSTLLSAEDEVTRVDGHSNVKDSILQWHSTVSGASVVESAFMCETAHVERHGIVLQSILGPNTSVAEGEVNSSLVGPFVGFHHQALLIAAVWPHGKGNVAYGANVGSNHTLKAPDQEVWPGEGVFFGLGCCIKFPTHLAHAPYSVIAAGVTTLPQRVDMPFALINTPGHHVAGLSPAINEIMPGWVLTHSVFTLLRNEHKFLTRNHARRSHIETKILRADIIDLMKDARQRLRDAEGKATLQLESGEHVFTEREVSGLGKNYMREAARNEAIAAYTFFLQVYALEGLLDVVESSIGDAHQHDRISPNDDEHEISRIAAMQTIDTLPSDSHAMQILQQEFVSTPRVAECLETLLKHRDAMTERAIAGKRRDDVRGQRIVPDYELVHQLVEQEDAVLYAQQYVW